MSDAFNTAEEELNFILGNDNNNDGSDVNDLFEDTPVIEDTMLFIDSPSRVKAKSSLNFAAAGEGGLVYDGTSPYGPTAVTTEEDEQKHTISRMVSLSPPPPPSLPPPSLHNYPSQAAAANTTDFASLYALSSLKDQNDIFDLLNNDPPVMSSLVPGSSSNAGGGVDLSYSHSENDPYKELLPVMNNNNSLLQQQLHNMLPPRNSLPSNSNLDKMLDTFKIEEGEYDSLNLLDTLNEQQQMTATFQDLQDRLGQFHPVNNGGGASGGLFGVGVVGGGLPPLSPQYDLLHASSATTTKASSSSSSITPDRHQGQVYVPIVHSVAHLPLPTPNGKGGETNIKKKVGHNKRRPLRKRKVSMSDIAPEDVTELNLLQQESEPILDFFSNYTTTDTSGLLRSVSVGGGGGHRSSTSRKKAFGYRAPTIFHSHPRLKGLKPILPTGAEAIAARRARKVRRLARAKAQVVNLVGAEDVDDIVEDTMSIITNVNVMATIEKCQEELVRDFTQNLNVKVFVDSVWKNTEIKNKITEEVDVPKDSNLEIKLPQDCPSSPHKGSTTTTTTCVTPNEKKTTASPKAEKSGPSSSADHLKLLPEGKDPESRRLRRLMRNRLSAQASRDRRKKVVDDLMKEKETKRNEIELLKQQVLEEQKRMILLEKAVTFALGHEKYSSAASIANSSNIIQSV